MSERPTLLLVHGAWHGSWCWRSLTEVLRSRGWSVSTVDLPTVHSPGRDDVGMLDDAAVVADAVAGIDGPVVVVAHSYGGIPVTQGATDPRVTHIVYIAAFALDAGESLLAAVGGTPPDWWHVEDGAVTAGDADHTPRDLFYADVDAAEADAAIARLLPQSYRSFSDQVTEVAWRDRPTTYIVTENDQAVPVFAQEMLAQRSNSAAPRLSSSHSPFMSQPDAVADIIETAALS